ncbi:Thermospermine synthase ACAULIS5 [Sesamum alatum]|uniref:thermospermine synthase n=1 Tax=Sesamum alatum TaxID=300844 RepID=A0AAE1Y218_9LAMI|nr:Thermospermine synthase ACAULIS5 [Sesamum alatum]
MGEAVETLFPYSSSNGFSAKDAVHYSYQRNNNNGHMIIMEDDDDDRAWFEEEIDVHLKWSFALNRVLHKGTSEYQDIALLDTKHFGKVLVIDGKMQSAEVDEFIYHECLIHPALLAHPMPKTVFIMGGGEGSAAREALRHTSIEKVEVVDFCRKHLTANYEAFCNAKLVLVINDAKAELERREEKFDIIVGDLADPVEGGPCYQLYTKSFYQNILKPKLNNNGIFVTQAGPAGVFTHKEVFSSIYNTIRQVFKYVRVYTAHVPSFADTWGWVIASDEPLSIEARKMDKKIAERIDGELLYLNGASFVASTILNKTVAKTLKNESHVYSEDNARFIHGQGVAYRIN